MCNLQNHYDSFPFSGQWVHLHVDQSTAFTDLPQTFIPARTLNLGRGSEEEDKRIEMVFVRVAFSDYLPLRQIG